MQSNHTDPNATLTKVAPALFVLLWSTGFIGSKYGSLHAEPFTMTAIRMSLVVCLLTIIAFGTGAVWPKSIKQIGHLAIAGILVHATYLCGILYALRLGVSVATVAIVAGIQPVLTALLARVFIGERLRAWQWLGMALGLLGVLLVVHSKYDLLSLSQAKQSGLYAAFVGLCGITLGTLYQKRFCTNVDLATGAVVQYLTTAAVCAICAVLFESLQVDWSLQFIGAIAWLAIALSIGAIGLLYFMIRHGAASRVASLFFLTPSVTAILAFLLFGEHLRWPAMIGMLVTACGVALVNRRVEAS